MDYLEQHNIYQLVDVLGASLFYNKPENPVEFLIEQLKSLQRLRQGASDDTSVSNMFSEDDLNTLFSMFSKKMDTITAEQAVTGTLYY